MSYVDLKGATLQGMAAHHNLWMTERLPESNSTPITLLTAQAEPKHNMRALMLQWAENGGFGQMPRSTQGISRRFAMALKQAEPPVILVVEQAHVLRKLILRQMRVVSEHGATVILQGNVHSMLVKTENFKDFYQRVLCAIPVTKLFDE